MWLLKEIQDKANALLQATNLLQTFPLPIEQVVEYLGFQCHFYIPDDDIKDISSAVSHTKRKIYVNENISPERQRFTIACKIGHIILHGDNKDYIDDHAVQKDTLDKEAEYFAYYLLMPETIFHKQWRQLANNISTIATFFGVTSSVIQQRIEMLGLFPILH